MVGLFYIGMFCLSLHFQSFSVGSEDVVGRAENSFISYFVTFFCLKCKDIQFFFFN